MPLATPTPEQGHEQAYSEPRFWRKVSRHASSAGRDVLEKALWLYYGVKDPATPKWARRVIYGALGYFILPLDALPDLAPLVGYTDDLGVLAAALAAVAFTLSDDVKAKSRNRLARWFPDASGAPAARPDAG